MFVFEIHPQYKYCICILYVQSIVLYLNIFQVFDPKLVCINRLLLVKLKGMVFVSTCSLLYGV